MARFVLPPLRESAAKTSPLLAEPSSRSTARRCAARARLGDGVLEWLSATPSREHPRAENLVEQGVALAIDGLVRLDDIVSPEMRQGGAIEAARGCCKTWWTAPRARPSMNVLREVDGNKEKAAEVLGLSSTTLWRKMKRLELSWP
ncbi:MAG: hypothetical protein IPH72_34510 [Sandaracinaceae bacterium]|nr:hypothetical protein [Sandaracinaceae bacterium]